MDASQITASQKDEFIDQYKQQLAVAQTQELLSVCMGDLGTFHKTPCVIDLPGTLMICGIFTDNDREVLQEVC